MLETGGRIPEPELPVDSEPIPDSQTESEPAPTDEDNENSSETLVNSSSEEE